MIPFLPFQHKLLLSICTLEYQYCISIKDIFNATQLALISDNCSQKTYMCTDYISYGSSFTFLRVSGDEEWSFQTHTKLYFTLLSGI